jgi:hypothetical protein
MLYICVGMDTGELSTDVSDDVVGVGDESPAGGFIQGGRLGQWMPEENEKPQAKAKGNGEKPKESNRQAKIGQITEDAHESTEERDGGDEEDQPDTQAKAKQEKSKEPDISTEFKRLKNAVPALQRQVQEYQNQLKQINPDAIKQETFKEIQAELADWFKNNPDEVIAQALKVRGVDKNQYFRDKFLEIAEFEQKSDGEKQAILAQRDYQDKLQAAEQRIKSFEQQEQQKQQVQQKTERANFRSNVLQFVAKFCDENGLPSNSPMKVVRVVESIVRAAEAAKAGDPEFAELTDHKIAKFYHDASWDEMLLDIQHAKWSTIKQRPDATKLLESFQRIMKEKAAEEGTSVVKRPTKKLVASDTGEGHGWGNFINEHDLNKMRRKGSYYG